MEKEAENTSEKAQKNISNSQEEEK